MKDAATISSGNTVTPAAVTAPSAEADLREERALEYLKPLPIQRKLSIGAADDPLEEEADAMADKVVRMPEQSFIQYKCTDCGEEGRIQNKPLTSFIQRKAEFRNATATKAVSNRIEASKGGGQPMEPAAKTFMESHLGNSFSNVRIHADEDAAELSKHLNAQAFTVCNDIYFNEGKYEPSTNPGKFLLAHELVHTIQQGHNGVLKKIQRTALPTDLSAYPEIDRRRIQIGWTAVTVASLPGMNDSFGTTPATAGGIAVSNNTGNGTVVFNGNVPASPSTTTGYDVRHGLNNIANHLETSTNILPLNSTITITLDLTPYGGINGNYRFSYFEHASGTGATATLSEVTLIEQLGAATATPAVANPGNAAAPGSFTHRGQTFTLASGWTLQQQAILNQALALVPANGITQLAGVTFDIGSVSGTEEGHYDETTHTITIRTSAFNNRLNAYEGGSDAIRIILHEIAHAIDRMPVRTAWNRYTAGGQTAAGRRTLEGTRSPSGSSYVFDASQDQHVLQEGAAATAFRTAVIADRTQRGVTLPGGITSYSTTNWEENFAEAFGMYMTDRALFQQLRPNTFRYFQTNYP